MEKVRSGDTIPCRMTGCKVTPVILHGVVSPGASEGVEV
jgi:hypothetical protein